MAMRYAGSVRKVLGGVLLALLVQPCASAASLLQYENGRFSGELQHADVTAVLADVGQLAQVEIRGRPLAPAAPVDLKLRGASLHQALTQLLSRQSFLIFYLGERPVRVVLVAASSTRSVVDSAGAPAEREDGRDTASGLAESGAVAETTTTTAAATTADNDPAAASNRPVTIHGELARALGTDSMSFSDVTGVAARDPNPAVRAEALRVGLSILEDDSALGDTFLQMLEQRDDAALADWLTRVAGDNALEIARGAARESRIDALRLRAGAVAQHLEAVQ